MAEELHGGSAACCKHQLIVVRVSVEVPEDLLPGVVYESGGEPAAGTATVRVGVEVGGQVRQVVLQLSSGVQGSTSMVQIGQS